MPEKQNNKRIQMLSKKWMNGTITELEKQEYDSWYASFKDNEINDLTPSDIISTEERIYESIINDRRESARNEIKGENRRSWMMAACVALFILSGLSVYFFDSINSKSKKQLYSEIKPGRDNATLSLGNGSTYDLDSLKTGEIFTENGIRIEKAENGELKYSLIDANNIDTAKILFNTVTTPLGGQYKLRLPDGSAVWLNAASSLKFPVAFDKSVRIVELTGEAYFEVSENKNAPFKVITDNQSIEVLGTSFNVNSYDEETSTITSLVEGIVKVSTAKGKEKYLRPGQQSIVGLRDDVQVRAFDIQEITAWKNGEFMFNNESLESALRKIARWYNVEFIYKAEVRQIPIWGSVSRYEDIKELLKIIELTEAAHFKIEGRRIYVMK